MISKQPHRKKKIKKKYKAQFPTNPMLKDEFEKINKLMNDDKSNIKKKLAHVTIWRELGVETEEIRGKTKEERK